MIEVDEVSNEDAIKTIDESFFDHTKNAVEDVQTFDAVADLVK